MLITTDEEVEQGRVEKVTIKVWLNRLTELGFDCFVNNEKYNPKKK